MSIHTLCLVCVIVGIAIPLLTILINIVDGFADFVSIDIFHLDFGGDFYIDFLPLSVNSLCLWALLFGAIGLLLEHRLAFIWIIVIGVGIGYIAAVVLQSSISRLKKVENYAADKDEVLLREGTVSNRIPENGVGAVSIQMSSGSNVSYPARSFDGHAINQDVKVKIDGFKGDYLIVRSSNYLEEKYDSTDVGA